MAVKIRGTGNAANPSIIGDDDDTGLVYGTNQIDFSTGGTTRATIDSAGALDVPTNFPIKVNGSEKLRIDSSGNLGIAVTPSDLLHLKFGTNLHMRFNSGVDSLPTINAQQDSGAYNGLGIRADNLRFHTGSSPEERMRIESDGKMKFGTTSAQDGENYHFYKGSDIPTMCINHASSGTTPCLIIRHGRGGLSGFDGKAISFRGNDGTEEGSIVIGTTNTAYNTSSDYRLKENEVAISDGITRLKTLKPYRFNFKKDTKTTVDGFFAHEVTAVPEAITGTKDEIDSDSNPVYQGIDQSKLVPLLTAALQEAVAKIEVLETKVAALEAG